MMLIQLRAGIHASGAFTLVNVVDGVEVGLGFHGSCLGVSLQAHHDLLADMTLAAEVRDDCRNDPPVARPLRSAELAYAQTLWPSLGLDAEGVATSTAK
jgi:hypothetical protein